MKGERTLRALLAQGVPPTVLGHELAARAKYFPVLGGMLDAQNYEDAATTITELVRALRWRRSQTLYAVVMNGPYLIVDDDCLVLGKNVVMYLDARCEPEALAEAIRHEDHNRRGH